MNVTDTSNMNLKDIQLSGAFLIYTVKPAQTTTPIRQALV